MPLLRIPEPFDHPDWIYELKLDGFRAIADVKGHVCTLTSRNGHTFTKFKLLAEEIAHSVHANDALLDGEIVCLDADGRSNFHKLLFRREWPHFFAFDLLAVNGEDLRDRPLIERKRRLKAIMPRIESRLLYVDHVREQGTALFTAVCERDLEGVVAKLAKGRYHTDGVGTSWLKIRNPTYMAMEGRRELFEQRRDVRQRRRRGYVAPVLALR
jgi:bifunctional non-homologous end joining protein LigD